MYYVDISKVVGPSFVFVPEKLWEFRDVVEIDPSLGVP